MATATAGLNEAPTYHGGLESLDQEYSYWIDEVDGKVPADLRGTFFRNGPGRQTIGGTRYGHWFDGDGMLCAFTFPGGGKVHFKNAYVRTPKYVNETAAQKILYRGFGTQIPGGAMANAFKLPTTAANTNTIYHGGRLLALAEGGRPWEFKPDTLETVGEYTYGGALSKFRLFSAHGKVHPTSGDYINFGAGVSGMSLKGPRPCIHIYRIDPAGTMINEAQLRLDGSPFCHDFAITEKYAVFFINSIVFGGMGRFFLGQASIADGMRFDETVPMTVIVVDLDTLREVKRFETDPGAIIHFGNAFEHGDEIVVDGMYAADFDAGATLANVFSPDAHFGGGVYHRYTLNMTTGTLRVEKLVEQESEFPTFNTRKTGRKHGACYTACSVDNGANSFFNAFQKVTFDGDSTLVTLPPGCYGSEPMFAPAENATREDDGYLLVVVYDAYAHKSELQIYRADNVTDQVCRLGLKHHLPHQFHGYFTPALFVG